MPTENSKHRLRDLLDFLLSWNQIGHMDLGATLEQEECLDASLELGMRRTRRPGPNDKTGMNQCESMRTARNQHRL